MTNHLESLNWFFTNPRLAFSERFGASNYLGVDVQWTIRSGATLQVATEILYRDAKCHNVYVL
ncbi:MAG: hypothetical protein IBX55_23455, partial [Methyloprofundus sp.]|nr:hypothetical protein [Methyloprofundus sp.]